MDSRKRGVEYKIDMNDIKRFRKEGGHQSPASDDNEGRDEDLDIFESKFKINRN